MLCIARTMPWQDVCPSVCLPVCLPVIRRYSDKTVKDILKLFTPSGSHTILVFSRIKQYGNSDGDPPNGGVECKEWMKKIEIFDQYFALSEIQYKIEL